MSFPRKFLLPAAGLLLSGWASGLRAAEPPNPPSKVENPVTEASLPVLQLTPQAVQRLGIATAPLEKKSLPAVRFYPGSVRIPAGDAADALSPPPVTGPDELRKLAELQAVADGAVQSATAVLEAAVQARKRAETLSQARAGSDRALDEAKAAEAQARAAMTMAGKNRALLGRPAAEIAMGTQRWIAVVVPALDLARLDLQKPALVKVSAAAPDKLVSAAPVARAATVLAGGGVETFFALGGDAPLAAGQQVEVQLAEKNAAAAAAPVLTAPWSSIVYDASGSAWVYEQKTAESFVRRRVSVTRVAGETAILSSGPPEGTKVVRTGTAELFGAEFGGFK